MHTESPMFTCFSNGKLLLTGEYFVLHGARALAVPVKFGQDMQVYPSEHRGMLVWQAQIEGSAWFNVRLSLPDLIIHEASDPEKAIFLQKALLAARTLNREFLAQTQGIRVVTNLNYPQQWGMGSSTTFMVNLARWSKTDPWKMYEALSSGSGYDLACVQAGSPVLFQRKEPHHLVKLVSYQPSFRESIYFLYQGRKQDTDASVTNFRYRYAARKGHVKYISMLTNRFFEAVSLDAAIQCLEEHEEFVGRLIQLPTIKSQFFPDFPGTVKSLGAWGGDFAMVLSKLSLSETKDYFCMKGFNTLIKFDDMILNRITD